MSFPLASQVSAVPSRVNFSSPLTFSMPVRSLASTREASPSLFFSQSLTMTFFVVPSAFEMIYTVSSLPSVSELLFSLLPVSVLSETDDDVLLSLPPCAANARSPEDVPIIAAARTIETIFIIFFLISFILLSFLSSSFCRLVLLL